MADKMGERVLIIGCGYIGLRVAMLHKAAGDTVTGIVRSKSAADKLQTAGITALQLDLDRPFSSLPTAGTLLYYLAPPPANSTRDTRMTAVLSALDKAAPRKMLYMSTTGVYGDCKGCWIDESTPVNPQTERGQKRLDAEQQLTKYCRVNALHAVILRVAAIYGPGRLPLSRLERKAPVLRPEDSGYTNRIHADDLASICTTAMVCASAGAMYNVSDGCPATFTEYIFCLADLLGVKRPPIVDAADAARHMEPGLLEFLRESKRISNHRLLGDLEITLRYPDFRQGLQASFSLDQS